PQSGAFPTPNARSGPPAVPVLAATEPTLKALSRAGTHTPTVAIRSRPQIVRPFIRPAPHPRVLERRPERYPAMNSDTIAENPMYHSMLSRTPATFEPYASANQSALR